MRRPEWIARQSGQPSGIFGRLLAWIMEHETAAHNASALGALDLAPTDRVLEVGFGHGRTIEALAKAVPMGKLAGIDHSPAMLHLATERCARLPHDTRPDLRCGTSAELPWPNESFDKVLAVHTTYFWADPEAHLREVARVLSDNATIVLGFRPADDPACADFPGQVYRFHERAEMHELLDASGFIDNELIEVAPEFVLARGRRRRRALGA